MANAKGTTFISFVRYLRSQRARSLEALPEDLHHYLDERILVSRWYPEEDLLRIARTMARMLGGDVDENLRNFGRIAVQEQIQAPDGVYAHLAGSGDPHSFGRRFFALWSSQHDSGQAKAEITGERCGVLRLEDYGHPSPEMCTILLGYIEQALSADLGEASVREVACRCDGADACEWAFSWS
jgi:hypothetical protein